MKYKLVVAGGTFDLLHVGHKSFLTQILNQSEKLTLGLTSNKYVSSEKVGNCESFETRKRNLEKFLESFPGKVEIIPIDDLYGPLLNPKLSPDVIALTDATRGSMDLINEKRQDLGLNPLKSIIIPMEKGEDGYEISSSKIRNGQIDRNGNLFFNPYWSNKTFKLPDNLRKKLKKPFGKVLDGIPDGVTGEKTIAVGDITSKLFNDKNISPFLSIIDFHVHREKKYSSITDLGFKEDADTVNVENEKGSISPKLIVEVRKAFEGKEKTVILIDGEDDLAVLPCLIFSPLGYLIFYGQPNEGLVMIEVTLENKKKAFDLISSFEIV